MYFKGSSYSRIRKKRNDPHALIGVYNFQVFSWLVIVNPLTLNSRLAQRY